MSPIVKYAKLGIDAKVNYGAIGDGITDDTAALQNSLNAAAGTAGIASNSVHVPPGIYITGPLTIPHGVILHGAGMRATTLKAKAGVTTGSALLTNVAGARMMTVRDLRLQGNLANQGTAVVGGIDLDGGTGSGATEYTDLRAQLLSVHVEDFTGDAFTVVGRGACQIANCVAWNNKGNGFQLDIDSELSNCDAGACKNGFRIIGNTQITGCKAWFAGYYNGAVVSGVVSGGDGHGFKFDSSSSGVIATAITAQDCAAVGIKLKDSTRIAISGWLVDSCNNATGGTANNVEVDNSYSCTLVGGHNLDRNPPNAARPASGLRIFNGSANNYIQCTTSGLTTLMNTTGQPYQNVVDIDQSGGGSVSQAFASSFTPDNTRGAIIDIGALTGNMTINAPLLNISSSSNLTLLFTQDSTGGRTVTFNSVYRAYAWQPTSTANATSNVTFCWNGNAGKWEKVSSQN